MTFLGLDKYMPMVMATIINPIIIKGPIHSDSFICLSLKIWRIRKESNLEPLFWRQRCCHYTTDTLCLRSLSSMAARFLLYRISQRSKVIRLRQDQRLPKGLQQGFLAWVIPLFVTNKPEVGGWGDLNPQRSPSQGDAPPVELQPQ